MAYGYEIAEDLVADVGPSLEYFLGRRPVHIADLASFENTPAAPPSFDIFDAFEQLGGFGTAVFFADGCYQRLSVGGDITPTAALRMAEHDEKAARNVHDLQMILICFLQDRQIAVFRREGNHARQGRVLTEFDRVERIEVNDHAMLALRDLLRQKTVPIARAWCSLDMLWL